MKRSRRTVQRWTGKTTRCRVAVGVATAATVLAIAGFSFGAFAAPQKVAATLEDEYVEVSVDGKLFTRYKVAGEPFTYGNATRGGKRLSSYRLEDAPKYPYFYPVIGPASGKSVTTELSEPYPHHHSLYFGCDRVNNGNYWQDVNRRGRIISQGPKIVDASGDRVLVTDECLWKQPRKAPVIRDARRILITAPNDRLRFIDFEITLEALTDVLIEKSNHSLFSARITPELSVKSGGTIINADGKTNPEGTHGVVSPWCDYFGTRDGITEGMAIFQHPANRWYPCRWFTRDYGFFSPTPMNWLEESLEIPKGETLTLRYRVVVHAGDATTAKVAGLFEHYTRAADTTPGTSD